MAFIHYLIKCFFHFLLHVFWVFPVKGNRIAFLNELSFKYGDNLKYLNEYIKTNYPGKYELVYPLINKEEAIDNDLHYIKPFSLIYFKYLLTSSVIITNAGGTSYLPIRKNQLIVNTWHGGGPYKKTGNTVYEGKWYYKELEMQRKNVKYVVSSCKMCTDYEFKGMLYEKEACLPFGMPRNDIFFDSTLPLRKKVFDTFNLKDSIKIVLFAPTFRSDATDFTDSKKYHVSDIDYEKLLFALRNKFDGEWKLAIRLHPKLKNVKIDVPNAQNFTEYPDMQELLYASDVVITDYSSLMWDFSFTGRPCFIYADDIDEYERDRGFYMPSSQWPFPIAKTSDEMIKNIESFDLGEYQRKLKKHHKESGSYECGEACESVINFVKKYLDGDE